MIAMALLMEQIDSTLWIKRVLGVDKVRRKSGINKYKKKCMNRIIRHLTKKIDLSPDDLNLVPKKRYCGWEY